MKIIMFDEMTPLEGEKIELAEEDVPQYHTTKLYSCMMPGIFHSCLIPWYPSGFE